MFSKRVLLAAGAGLAIVAAGCSGGQDEQAAPAPAPPAPAVPSPADSVAPGQPRVLNVDFRGGQVNPPAGTIDVRRGEQLKIRVTSDRHDDIEIAGYPDKTEDVDPDEAEGIDFVPDHAGDIPIRLRTAGVPLLTLRVS
ncbi:hypothetical protein [Amycolatopsis nigrescens]|uniref:hypothetical protein n=1 Tax=Amycolatopsis nigrescens TaxID=381445 RepID=UPI00035E217B|nr:hypothetical protein [Amycolatopsis nigrescens]